ncbi:MAG: choice-of-anchor M domain-containing protein [Verrucomicrobia bacterium]|nr:choice-of-anchor M domain-containing protein [Verrucomicrobiota bacterium]
MKNQLNLAASVWLATALAAPAQSLLTAEHVDVGIGYDGGLWDLHVHDETNDQEYEPGDAILFVGMTASNGVPANPLFNFLGNPDDPVWILPQNQNPSLLYLGIGSEELRAGVFVGDLVTLTLSGVSGPGHFALYQTDTFGSPTVFMNSRDGITAGDSYTMGAGNHAHFNWAFSGMGTYTLSFEASGTLVAGNQFTSSGPVDYTFQVVPEPGSVVLFILGGLGLLILVRQRLTPG